MGGGARGSTVTSQRAYLQNRELLWSEGVAEMPLFNVLDFKLELPECFKGTSSARAGSPTAPTLQL